MYFHPVYFKDKTVLITGASSGIGEALAYAFAKENASLLLCARNEQELKRVKANIISPCEIFVCDITNYLHVDAMLAEIAAQNKTIDVLVNNAGISQRGLAFETDFNVDERIMAVNYFATVYLTKKVLPSMMERKNGNIIVISSVSGKYGFWQRSAYSASKHALQGFFETLQIELKEYNINTLLVCPGGVKTNISQNALEKDGTPHGKTDDLQTKGISPESLAAKVLSASAKGKKQILVGKGEVNLYYIKKWWPWLFFKITERLKGR
jgi:dehydrogenase/reductase SDR family protein 7B